MKQAISDMVFEEIKGRIEHGEYWVGQKLPAEQELCGALSVGRSTVREAMRMLQACGFVSIKRGSGTFVISSTGNAPATVGSWLAENRDRIADYMNVRTAIECLAIRQFIAHWSLAKVQRLAEIEQGFEKAVETGDIEGMVKGDESMHGAIAEATGNGLLIDINKQLLVAFRQYRYLTFPTVGDRAEAVSAHREIIESLSLRDTDLALLSMQKHMNTSLHNAVRSARESEGREG